jgi:hypothetical protein
VSARLRVTPDTTLVEVERHVSCGLGAAGETSAQETIREQERQIACRMSWPLMKP